MAIPIKNDEQIRLMKISGEIVAKIHETVRKEIRPGVTTKELNDIAEECMKSHGARSSTKGYKGFPSAICVSVNEEVIHGIPGLRKLKNGDIVSVDITINKDGYHADAARTHPVGDVSEEASRLMEVTKQSFFEGIKYAKAGGHLYEISGAIQKYAEARGFSLVREFCGHGVGKKMHEEPSIPNYKPLSRGPRLVKGMTLAIEPMVNVGTYEINILRDNWTVVTRDGKLSAHYENTVHITDGVPEVITLFD